MLFNGLLVLIIAATVAMLFRDGLYSNAITLINTVIAGIVAVNYYEPATRYLSELVPYMDYNWDVMVLGVLFAITYSLLRFIGLQVSEHQVRLHPLADQIGGGVLSLLTGWVAVCFLVFALHTSPLARTFFFGGFQPEQPMFFGLGPDRKWLGFIDRQSVGSWGTNATDEAGNVTSRFDPKGDFLLRHASRRAYLEKRVDAFAPAGS